MAITLQVKRRTDADKTIQHMFESRLKDIAENIEKAYAAKLEGIQNEVGVLTKVCPCLHKTIASSMPKCLNTRKHYKAG